MSDPTITFFQNSPPQTVFAPTWNYAIYEGDIKNVNFKTLAKFILKKEKEILKRKKVDTVTDRGFGKGAVRSKPLKDATDGYTGLGGQSITARHKDYNLLDWEHPDIPNLKKGILDAHARYLKELQIPLYPELYAQCWANVMRKGEHIKPHLHGINAYCYLGGLIVVQADNTNTNYINPVNQVNEPEIHESPNKTGKICLFPSYIPHYTDVHPSAKPRITIAFDLVVSKTIATSNFVKIL